MPPYLYQQRLVAFESRADDVGGLLDERLTAQTSRLEQSLTLQEESRTKDREEMTRRLTSMAVQLKLHAEQASEQARRIKVLGTFGVFGLLVVAGVVALNVYWVMSGALTLPLPSN